MIAGSWFDITTADDVTLQLFRKLSITYIGTRGRVRGRISIGTASFIEKVF